MNIVFSYIRLLVFLGCALAGVQVPGFVDQYGKSLEAHVLESQFALQEFQADADKFFEGNLERLIAHYKASDDAVFHDGGSSIETIYARNVMLKANLAAFRSSFFSAYQQALFAPVPDVGEEVRSNYTYTVQLNPVAVGFGLGVGFFIALGIELLLRLLCFLGRRFVAASKKRKLMS
ncbi:DUF2937 domain-containing protein [Aliidiomarina taiwanensis]|uniref:DUF2937 domain-containing protein n=1 Tax=Aliidiomarina taiwanensis TaxID=946228 RepID=A0A432X154_9GAMM|nr:DUF2937 family protein [Aliidiomarina taiwanensis]RUO39833.1 DUF2937 domain-containing protein [Aliidiomarina taiwanensis]